MRKVPRRCLTCMNTFSNTTHGHTQTNVGKHISIRFPAKYYWLSFRGDEMKSDRDKPVIQGDLSRMNHKKCSPPDSWSILFTSLLLHLWNSFPDPCSLLWGFIPFHIRQKINSNIDGFY